jgi:hypothetical protein
VSPATTTPTPFGQPPAPGTSIPELVLAGLLLLAGVWSLVKWMRTAFAADSWGERVLYLVHVTARVGLWFAFAAYFLGLALVDDAEGFTWFLLIPLALAGLQLVTGVALGQGGRRER